MKMTDYQLQLPPERKVIVLVAILFFNLVLVSSNVVLENKRSLLQNVVGVIVAPFQIAFQKTVDFVSQQTRHYVFLKNSFKKYHQLKKKHFQLVYENYILKKKIAEQDFLNRLKVKRSNFIKVDVISIDRNFPLSSVLINKGTASGIVKDMTVLNGSGELVGKVVEPISLFSAKIQLITNPIGGTGAYIKHSGSPDDLFEGLLRGNNSTICNFKYLIENKKVAVGDIVITSGTDKIFPPYLPIGKVVKLKKEYLTQDVEVEPFFIKRSIKQLIIIPNDRLIDEKAAR
jgi:rod shape-determining protein MreC